ncbi:MAG: hypothetical protein AAF203_10670 [Pseudomonadota bacterium]
MKFLTILCAGLLFAGCMLRPPIAPQSHHALHPEISDLDNLEMLLLNEQQPIYESNRNLASTDNIRLGMEKRRVEMNLGLPTHREVAGNPKYGNERWIYEKSIPTLDGYYQEKKVIYFEGGNVVGWESH